MTPEDRIEVQTTKRAQTSWLFAIFVFAVLAFVFWITETPKRWLVPIVAIVCGVGLYAVLR